VTEAAAGMMAGRAKVPRRTRRGGEEEEEEEEEEDDDDEDAEDRGAGEPSSSTALADAGAALGSVVFRAGNYLVRAA
jgi:hypothetical protein